MNLTPLLANLKPVLPPATEKGPFLSPMARDIVMIALGALLIGLIAILWAAFIRRRSRRDKRSPLIEEDNSLGWRRRHRRRRKHKQSFSRNPTLADTGGLPPVKEKSSLSNPPQ